MFKGVKLKDASAKKRKPLVKKGKLSMKELLEKAMEKKFKGLKKDEEEEEEMNRSF